MDLSPVLNDTDKVLRIYLLGMVDFEAALLLQRRLVYEVSGDRNQAALILCQHMPIITVGRQGSHAHIFCEPEDLQARQWRIRWVNRGGGCMLHVPGQLAIYPILPLDRLGMGLPAYVSELQDVLLTLLSDFSIHGTTRARHGGIWAGTRMIAATGISVRDWVSYYGAVLNINPALEPFRLVQCAGRGEPPMTSVERERRAPLSPALLRQRLIEHFTNRFGFARFSLFSDHPMLDTMQQNQPALSHR